jgi:hypothetical protein
MLQRLACLGMYLQYGNKIIVGTLVDFPESGIHFHISHLHDCARERPKPKGWTNRGRIYPINGMTAGCRKRYLKVCMTKALPESTYGKVIPEMSKPLLE